MEKINHQRDVMAAKYENHKDFYKKYNGTGAQTGAEPPAIPSMPLGLPDASWCLVFSLEPDEDEVFTKVSHECVDLCQRLWAADLDIQYEVGLLHHACMPPTSWFLPDTRSRCRSTEPARRSCLALVQLTRYW